MTHHSLICHPATPAKAVRAVEFSISYLEQEKLLLRWRVQGAGALVVPGFGGHARADGLWQTTCFEWFLMGEGPDYREFNFSPSQRWAAYRFADYRQGQAEAPLAGEGPTGGPVITSAQGEEIFTLNVTLPWGLLYGAARGGVAAVIEEEGGIKSYWALAHPRPKPDFHDAAAFVQVV